MCAYTNKCAFKPAWQVQKRDTLSGKWQLSVKHRGVGGCQTPRYQSD